MKKNRSPSPATLDHLRATWLAELTECEKRRSSLSQQISRAHRAGDSKKVAALTNQYDTLCPNPAWPEIKLPSRLIALDFGDGRPTISGPATNEELDKRIPQCLRNDTGRHAWQALAYWRKASESDKEKLRGVLLKLALAGNDAANALRMIDFELSPDGQDNFFEKLAVAKKEILQDAQFRVKAELMWYRASLNWSSTPGQKRHTIQEIKQIVDLKNVISPQTFRNWIYEFNVPHIGDKRGPKPR